MRTFLLAGNAARSGNPHEWATAARVVDFGDGDTMAPGQKLAAARALFELIDQTTFQLFPIPGRRATGNRFEVELKQAGTGVMLPVEFLRGSDDQWRLAMPKGDLRPVRDALLARSGGRLPPLDDIRRRATARDTIRSFAAGFADWNGTGRDQVFDALDLSTFNAANRDYEGELAAAYLNEAIDRIGKIVPQEISDDPTSRVPYVLFSHPAGAMVLAPGAEGEGWRFTSDTVRAARDLYTAIEDMPEVEGGALPDVPSTYMQIRRGVHDAAPALLTRIGLLEVWQALAVIVLLTLSLAAAWVVAWCILGLLRLLVGGAQDVAERDLRWPMRLAATFILYLSIVPVVGLPDAAKRVSTGASGVILALAVMWGGWKLLDTFGARALRRAEARAGTMDEIVVSLVLGACKLALLAGGLLFIAQALSLPYEGVLAGLGIGGLAVAFASKETLSNVFGAGILVADRPFRRGDWIEAGEARGTVEHVGIRSTRIRTGDDSLMFVPNGKLADATVNNLGTRRHRVTKAKLLVAHGTPADKLAAFTDGLLGIATAAVHVLPGTANTAITAISVDGIEVELTCCLNVRSGGEERADKTALMLDILRLADRMGIRLGDQDNPAPLAMAAE
ncbi:MAG: mechanosensitive ion channel family protein [Gemmatimonadaceae bacterium]|nr:mechanosensitive ion channel family protein [Acetobacteraceae bacterium]